jgi:hypothetical protein
MSNYSPDNWVVIFLNGNDPEWNELYCVSYEEALNTINEWDQIEKNNEEFWNHLG